MRSILGFLSFVVFCARLFANIVLSHTLENVVIIERFQAKRKKESAAVAFINHFRLGFCAKQSLLIDDKRVQITNLMDHCGCWFLFVFVVVLCQSNASHYRWCHIKLLFFFDWTEWVRRTLRVCLRIWNSMRDPINDHNSPTKTCSQCISWNSKGTMMLAPGYKFGSV